MWMSIAVLLAHWGSLLSSIFSCLSSTQSQCRELPFLSLITLFFEPKHLIGSHTGSLGLALLPGAHKWTGCVHFWKLMKL
ncbi:hypothetical protein BDL97_16G059300 [Sphagnum fallax]|nr:hypothetical protein BDL97_16G059300 [Sphagnum fallax]